MKVLVMIHSDMYYINGLCKLILSQRRVIKGNGFPGERAWLFWKELWPHCEARNGVLSMRKGALM